MKKIMILILMFFSFVFAQQKEERTKNFPRKDELVKNIPPKENVWVFIMAGQSNMAGRPFVSPQDTIPNNRLFSINSKNQLILAKEPLHFYEPALTGLDCGVSFGKHLLQNIPDSIYILVLPAAIGGSSIQQWINDDFFRGVNLLSNFKEKVKIGNEYGIIKGILWHQGENDTVSEDKIKNYQKRLAKLMTIFRGIVNNKNLPIIIGELGSYAKNNEKWQKINDAIHQYVKTDKYAEYINTQDLKDKGDRIHFNSEGQREMGKRFAEKYIDLIGRTVK